MQKQRNLDGHLTFYLLLSGFRNNQFSCFNFLTTCPMYLFVPHPLTPVPQNQPRWTVGHLGKWTWNNQREEKLPRGFTQ